MNDLARASLSTTERRSIERLVTLLQQEFGSSFRGVWLYGSRARGDDTGDDSDVDLLVVADRGQISDHRRAIDLAFDAALKEGANPMTFSIKLFDPELLADRRRIRSFFMQEVDRDKIVLVGDP